MPLLFAYGSAMALDAACLGPARLDDYALGFRRRSRRWGGGAADILPEPGAHVWGVVFELDAEALAELDRREGEGWAYQRISVSVALADRVLPAETYEVIEKEPLDVPVTPEYAAAMVGAAVQRGLPEDWIDGLRRLTSA